MGGMGNKGICHVENDFGHRLTPTLRIDTFSSSGGRRNGAHRYIVHVFFEHIVFVGVVHNIGVYSVCRRKAVLKEFGVFQWRIGAPVHIIVSSRYWRRDFLLRILDLSNLSRMHEETSERNKTGRNRHGEFALRQQMFIVVGKFSQYKFNVGKFRWNSLWNRRLPLPAAKSSLLILTK